MTPKNPFFILTYVILLQVLPLTKSTTSASAKTVLQDQIDALTAFKNSITHDPLGSLSDWIPTIHHCNWTGVSCDTTTNNVISISLIETQLEGTLSSFLGNLSELQHNQSKRLEQVETPEVDDAGCSTLKRFDSTEIEVATDYFNESYVLGKSNLSTVYKGRLEDGQIVAIKTLNLLQFPAESDKCFYREAQILSRIRHKNLVKVIGYAWESGKLKALILQYMENGNLEQVIHESSADCGRWTLSKRIELCVTVAEGLDYLHTGFDFPIIHCDLKPSNILLDRDWDAHVSDFGTARMMGVHLPGGHSSTTASAFRGTIGYMAPEFAYMRSLTTKVDIFSFGVVIMELFTKKRPTGVTKEGQVALTLSHIVERSIAEDKALDVVDPALASTLTTNEEEVVVQILKLALSCTSEAPENRPESNFVVSYLMKLQNLCNVSEK
ncbi:unnamed protein product [Amaranthus hypochondriacus]